METKTIYKPSVVDLLKPALILGAFYIALFSIPTYAQYSEMMSLAQFYGKYLEVHSFLYYLFPYLCIDILCVFWIFCVFFFSATKRAKKAVHLRTEIGRVRKIVCDGMASFSKGGLPTGGWLFLSVDALEFYPSRGNVSNECVAILLDDIMQVETNSRKLIIHTASGDVKFKVYKAKLWEEQITNIL